MPFNFRAIGVSGYLISDEYLPGATLRMSAPLSESSPVVAMYSMTPVPGIGVDIRGKPTRTAWRRAFSRIAGRKPQASSGPGTQAPGTARTANPPETNAPDPTAAAPP